MFKKSVTTILVCILSIQLCACSKTSLEDISPDDFKDVVEDIIDVNEVGLCGDKTGDEEYEEYEEDDYRYIEREIYYYGLNILDDLVIEYTQYEDEDVARYRFDGSNNKLRKIHDAGCDGTLKITDNYAVFDMMDDFISGYSDGVDYDGEYLYGGNYLIDDYVISISIRVPNHPHFDSTRPKEIVDEIIDALAFPSPEEID